ncbi:MAG TPA: dihydrodipicolinate synthase family protein, partial [Acidimicrobiales bacterium]|nr:dihydrodipicolinate synthase family protein [Acidimicrobiales bacterium]
MTEPIFRGVAAALVTLFDQSGELDAASTAKLAAELVGAGLAGVVVAGSTGEASALDRAERRSLVEAVRGALPDGVAVIAGTGAASRRQAAALTADAIGSGADGVLVLSPPGSAGLAAYYEAVAEAAGGWPVLAYHYPVVSSPGITVDELVTLPVDGAKDSSGEAERLLDTLTRWDKPLYTGSAAMLSAAGPLGCAGAILALANAEPEL